MSEILQRWIQGKLGLPFPHPQEPELQRRALSNGYLIGEVLRKYNVISDDQSVTLKRTVYKKDRVGNFQRLQGWLEVIGVRVHFQTFAGIIEEKPGSAINFLYKLYIWLENPKSLAQSGLGQVKVRSNGHQVSLEEEEVEEEFEEGEGQGSQGVYFRKGSSGKHPKSRTKVAKVRSRVSEGSAAESEFARSVGLALKAEKMSSEEPEATQADLEDQIQGPKVRRGSIKYKDLELQPLPPLLENLIPFGSMSEESQAQALYFLQGSLDVLEAVPEVIGLSWNATEETDPLAESSEDLLASSGHVLIIGGSSLSGSYSGSDLELRSRSRSIQMAKDLAKQEQEAFDEMNAFDERLQALSSGDSLEVDDLKELAPEKNMRVYRDGKGSGKDYEASLTRLKSLRAEEARASDRRTNFRKTYVNQIVQGVTSELYNEVENEVLKLTTNLPASERLLADFLRSSHQEKHTFISHGAYAAEQEVSLEDDIAKTRNADYANKVALVGMIGNENEEFRTEEGVKLKENLVLDLELEMNQSLTDAIIGDVVTLVGLSATYRKEHGGDQVPDEVLKGWKEEHFLKRRANEPSEKNDSKILAENSLIFGIKQSLVRRPTIEEEQDMDDFDYVTFPEDEDPFEAERRHEEEVAKKELAKKIETLLTAKSTEELFDATNLVHIRELVFALSDPNVIWRPSKVVRALKPILEGGNLNLETIDPRDLIQEAIEAFKAKEKALKSQEIEETEVLDEVTSQVQDERQKRKLSVPDQSEDLESDLESLRSPYIGISGSDSASVTSYWSASIQEGFPDEERQQKRISKLADNLEERIRKSAHKKRREKRREARRKSAVAESNFYLYKKLIRAPERDGDDDSEEELIIRKGTPKDEEAKQGPTKVQEQKDEELLAELGRRALEASVQGKLMGDDIVSELLTQRIKGTPSDTILVILNFPNTKCQLKHLRRALVDEEIDLAGCKK